MRNLLFAIGLFFALTANAQLNVVITNNLGGANNIICQNGLVTLTANPTGGSGIYTSYVWSNGMTGQTIQPATNAVGTQNISVIVTDNMSNTATSPVYPIHVVSFSGPLPSVNLSSPSACPYDTVTVTPAPNSNLVSSSYCNNSPLFGFCNIVPLPSSTPTTYTVTLSNTAGSCRTEADFTINTIATSCANPSFPALLPSTLSSQSQVPTGNFTIIKDIFITGNISFVGKNIQVDPGAKITVMGGGALSIRGSWLHTCNCWIFHTT